MRSLALHVVPRLVAPVGIWALSACSPARPEPATPPVVAGLATAGLDARVRGEVLLGELGCTACHAAGPEREPVDHRAGPDLAAVGARVDPAFLEAFLADPLRTEPGTPMPDVLASTAADGRGGIATALAHYLRSLAAAPFTRAPHDAAAAARGAELFATIGCVACHAPRDADGREVAVPGSVPLGAIARKYGPDGLRAFLLAPHDARPAGRMPDFRLSPQEAHDLGHYLTARVDDAATGNVAAPDPALVERGRALFVELRCAACHTGTDVPAPAPAAPLAALDPSRGCLADDHGSAPHYALTPAQRTDLRTALAAAPTPWTDGQRILVRLVARNCVACHARGRVGGPTPERAESFTTDDPALGEAGRIPPPLSGIGGKLQPAWLQDAIAFGQRARPYLHTRMPGFGPGAAATLAGLFVRADPVPDRPIAALPDDRDAARAVRDLGCELVGDQGMNCITCHTFAGTHVGAMAAIDLVETTAARLRPEWFHAYLLDPSGYRSTTIMPRFFVDGVSTRGDLGGGQPGTQIAAMWHYLAEGRNTRRPRGLRDEPIELTVGDRAVMLRRAVQDTGKRGISVGYPGGVSVTFDAESLAMNQVWWGGFLDVAPVFHGQGSGQAHVQSRELAVLGKGPAFAVLPDDVAPWPDASRRELGQRFLGYDLDDRGRPAFRYTCRDVSITDAARELPAGDGPRPTLRRTLTFATAVATTLYFRAAVAPQVAVRGPGAVRIGEPGPPGQLELGLPDGCYRILDTGEAREVRVRVEVPDGGAALVLDYSWQEGGR